ncbi:MAG: hypothetical protein JKY01_13435 [Pseudomonadales bacterium]|nr:hypothetical protein [Pseudomonadales bacterium]
MFTKMHIECMFCAGQLVDGQSPPCRVDPICELKMVSHHTTPSFLNTLKQYTLVDFVGQKRESLIQIFKLEDRPYIVGILYITLRA